MLRGCSNVLLLEGAISSSDLEMRWTNDIVAEVCMKSSDGRLESDCPLNTFYTQLIKKCAKLRAIEHSSKKHKTTPTLIISSFPKMTLVVERKI